MTFRPTYYELLGVDPSAPAADIEAAFRAQVMRVHPDQGGNRAVFHMLEDAYETTIDPVRRAQYDAALADEREGVSYGGGPATAPPYGGYLQDLENSNAESRTPGSHSGISIWDRFKAALPELVSFKFILLVALLAYGIYSVVTDQSPLAGGWSSLIIPAIFLWFLGSILLRLIGWGVGLYALFAAYVLDASSESTFQLLLIAFAFWISGHWFYTFRRGEWRSNIAFALLNRLPGRLRPDYRWWRA